MNNNNDTIRVVGKENPIIFSSDRSRSWNDFNEIAYATNGEAIYELRYPENINYIR